MLVLYIIFISIENNSKIYDYTIYEYHNDL